MDQSINFSQLLTGVAGYTSNAKDSQTESSGNDFSSILQGLMKGKKFSDSRANISDTALSDSLLNKGEYSSSGKKVIDSLKKAMINSGHADFETSGIDMEALSRIHDLLELSGVSKDKISSVISSLKDKTKGGAISLEDVFAELDTLEDSDFIGSEMFLDISSVPHIESILASIMGMNKETVSRIIDSSTDPENGINIGKLVKSLKSLDSRDFNSSGTSSSDGSSVSEILAQIGLETEANDKSGSMSLGRLITILEKNIDGSINQSPEDETATASLAKLINGLTDSSDSSKLRSLLNNNSSGSESDKKADLKKLIMAVSEASNQDTALSSLRALVSGAGIAENSALKKLVKSMSQDSSETEALTTLHTFNSAESNLTAEEKSDIEKFLTGLSNKSETGKNSLLNFFNTAQNIGTDSDHISDLTSDEKSDIEKFLTGLSNKSETGKNSLLNFFNNVQNIGTDSDHISDLTSDEKSDIEKLLNGLSDKGHNAETSLLNAFKNLKGNTSESGSASSNESEINTDLFSGPTVGSLLSGIVNSAKNSPDMSVSSDSTFNDAVSSSRSLMTKIKLGDTSESTDAINNKGINNSEKNKNSRISKEKSQNDTLKSFQEQMSELTGVQEKTTDQTDLEYISQNAGNIIETENIEKRPHKNLKNTDILETAAKIYGNTSSSGTLFAKLSDEQVATRPILPAYVSNQAAKGILKAAAGNENEIVINIKPPELGRMQIKIENTDAGIKVQIVTEKNMASDILNSNKNDIAAYLADAGIKIEKLDIQLSFNFDQTMSSFKEQAHNESGRRRNRKNDNGSHDDTTDNSSPDDENMTIEDRVSLTA